MAVIYGEYVKAVQLNDVQHEVKDEDLTSRVGELETDMDEAQGNINSLQSDLQSLQNNVQNLRGTVETAQGDISDLQGDVGDLQDDVSTVQSDIQTAQSDIQTAQGDIQTAQGDIDNIEDLIPNQASAQNQLADKSFVNSSITTNTANFLGTYSTLAEIEAIPNPTNNDYAFLETTDQAGNTLYDRYKYNATDNEWLFEYELNNSGFTAQQWATINSGLTQSSVDSDIEDAINALDVPSVGGAGEYIESISEADGKITAVKQTMDSTPTANSSKAVTSGGVKDYVDSQVTQAIAQVLNTGF